MRTAFLPFAPAAAAVAPFLSFCCGCALLLGSSHAAAAAIAGASALTPGEAFQEYRLALEPDRAVGVLGEDYLGVALGSWDKLLQGPAHHRRLRPAPAAPNAPLSDPCPQLRVQWLRRPERWLVACACTPGRDVALPGARALRTWEARVSSFQLKRSF